MKLHLKGREFNEFFSSTGLSQLDSWFSDFLTQHSAELSRNLDSYRSQLLNTAESSQFIIQCAPLLEKFLVELFQIESEVESLTSTVRDLDSVFVFKKHYVAKLAKRRLKKVNGMPSVEACNQWLQGQLDERGYPFDEQAVAKLGVQWMQDEENHHENIERLTEWCVRVLVDSVEPFSKWVMFKLPQKLNYDALVPSQPVQNDPLGRLQTTPRHARQREGFDLTDPRMSINEVMSEIDYCVYCHDKAGDFCSKGFPVKKGNPDIGYKTSPLNTTLTGCPLEEKISEMQWLKKQACHIGALAVVMIDNPMCPATGHRICNDCMKSCIYQKQDPVNIPQVETRVLTDVLALPWGVEIYDLLTRWNPLRSEQYIAKPYNGKKVLVMGMGPAGFTLAHHLLMEGFAVVGADGLKIEPIDMAMLTQPIRHFESIKEALSDRVMTGFGGVAEYGITVRWDKNFLKLILISLLRRQYFQLVGSVRFGGTLTIESAWEMGFDHLSIAVGAGLPKELVIPNSLAPGMRQANDFLMALQLTGAAKKNSIANLQVRLPAVIIGGGLTGIDAATELQAYYLLQIEKISSRFNSLVAAYGEASVRAYFEEHDLAILDEYLLHASQLQMERERAQKEAREVDVTSLVHRWGGVTVVYRRSMVESPAYQRNHEELAKALEEGLFYAEGLSPTSVLLDEAGHVKALECQSRVQSEEGVWMMSDEKHIVPAKTILVATGAKPNVAYGFEHSGSLVRRQFEYARFDYVENELKENNNTAHVKAQQLGPFTSYQQHDRFVSFLGDTHPVFHGSVVNAIASAKRFYPEIVKVTQGRPVANDSYPDFREHVESMLRSYMVGTRLIKGGIVELVVKSPQIAKVLVPGQFCRMQTYETKAETINQTHLHTEAVAAIGILNDKAPDTVRFLLDESEVNSRLLSRIRAGQRLSLMGPTGAKFPLPKDKTVAVMGGVRALSQVLALSHRAHHDRCKLVFFSMLTNEQLESFRGELDQRGIRVVVIKDETVLVTAVSDYFKLHAEASLVDQVQVFCRSSFLKVVQRARSHEWSTVLSPSTRFIASVYGPMQCMLKGVCAQCLQWQVDPVTGKRTKAVYACSWQTQPMEMVDFDNLNERLKQNQMQETLTSLWVKHTLESSKS